MMRMLGYGFGQALVLGWALLAPGAADADTIYVANNGLDLYGTIGNPILCGKAPAPESKKGGPCRSIRQSMANAQAGDTIEVGPGRYSLDLDGDGIFDEPGEEEAPTGFPSALPCAMIRVTTQLTLVSRSGSAVTILDGAGRAPVIVSIEADGVVFGKSGKGFTLTGAGPADLLCVPPGAPLPPPQTGVSVGASGVTVEGNMAVGFFGDGFLVGGSGNTLTENQAVGLQGVGFVVGGTGNNLTGNHAVANFRGGFQVEGSGHGLGGNVASANGQRGFDVLGDSFELGGNFASGNGSDGFAAFGKDLALHGNAAIGNRGFGFFAFGTLGTIGTITNGIIYGNNDTPDLASGLTNCGLRNEFGGIVDATGNFWGAGSGPGPNPADQVCTERGSVTAVEPHDTKE